VNRRQIHFADSAIAIEYSGEAPERIVAYLFQDIPESGPGAPHLTYRLAQDEQHAGLFLYLGEKLERFDANESDMAAYLLDRSIFHLADHCRGGLSFHAAALAWKENGVLLPGRTRSGKSTLAAWLLTQGFSYLTDELAFIPKGETKIYGFTRPLNLKETRSELLKEMLGVEELPEEIVSSHAREITPPGALKPGSVLDSAPLHVIIFPNFQQHSSFELEELSQAQAGKALMECLINARNLEGHGFQAIAELARATPAYRMSYGSFEQIGQTISRLAENNVHR
jgi:hypothetical protein